MRLRLRLRMRVRLHLLLFASISRMILFFVDACMLICNECDQIWYVLFAAVVDFDFDDVVGVKKRVVRP